MTLEEVGAVVDRTKATISSWEKGQVEPSYWQILAIWEHTNRAIPLPTIDDAPVEVAARFSISKRVDLSHSPRRLTEETEEAAKEGLPEAAFENLRSTLRTFVDLWRRPDDDLADLNAPPPREE